MMAVDLINDDRCIILLGGPRARSSVLDDDNNSGGGGQRGGRVADVDSFERRSIISFSSLSFPPLDGTRQLFRVPWRAQRTKRARIKEYSVMRMNIILYSALEIIRKQTVSSLKSETFFFLF